MPDLKTDEARRTFYGMIREFYLHIPPEFRAQVALPPERARASSRWPAASGARLCPRGFPLAPLRNLDPAVLAACSERFAREFGVPLLWIGGAPFRGRAEGLDGVIGGEGGSGIEAAALSPGRDRLPRRPPARRRPSEWQPPARYLPPAQARNRQPAPAIESRRMAAPSSKAGSAASRSPGLAAAAELEQLAEGTDVAPTHEYGSQYLDLTRAGASQFKGGVEYAANILQTGVPPVMAPRVLYQAQVVVQNTGQKVWTGGGFGLSYRWFKDGRARRRPDADRSTPRTPLRASCGYFNLGLTVADDQGQAAV